MLYDGVEGEAVVAGAFTVTPEARVNSPMRNMCCGALWIDSRFVMPSLRSPAAGESSRRMNGSLQRRDEISELSETWYRRPSASKNGLRQTDRVGSAARRPRFCATAFSLKIAHFGSEFHPCNYLWQFRHCDDTKNRVAIRIRSPGYVSRETHQNWKICQSDVSRGT